MLRAMNEVQPSLPPIRVVTHGDRSRVFHEHPAADDPWVELPLVDGRYVCPRCGQSESADTRLPD